jgi:hypothetical protein
MGADERIVSMFDRSRVSWWVGEGVWRRGQDDDFANELDRLGKKSAAVLAREPATQGKENGRGTNFPTYSSLATTKNYAWLRPLRRIGRKWVDLRACGPDRPCISNM